MLGLSQRAADRNLNHLQAFETIHKEDFRYDSLYSLYSIGQYPRILKPVLSGMCCAGRSHRGWLGDPMPGACSFWNGRESLMRRSFQVHDHENNISGSPSL